MVDSPAFDIERSRYALSDFGSDPVFSHRVVCPQLEYTLGTTGTRIRRATRHDLQERFRLTSTDKPLAHYLK